MPLAADSRPRYPTFSSSIADRWKSSRDGWPVIDASTSTCWGRRRADWLQIELIGRRARMRKLIVFSVGYLFFDMAASLELPSLQEEFFWKWPTLKDSKGSSEYGSVYMQWCSGADWSIIAVVIFEGWFFQPVAIPKNKRTLRNSNFKEQEKLCDIAGNGPDPWGEN